MTDEDGFLAALALAPDDPVIRLVFADWLDEQGEPSKAAFLRAECHIGPPDRRPRTGIESPLDHLRRLAEPLAPAWLAAVSRPPLSGSTWVATDDRDNLPGGEVFMFDPSGTVYYNSRWIDESPLTPQGPWRQVGPWVQFVVNHYQDGKPYSTVEGTVTENRMSLRSIRRDGSSARLRLRRREE